jgi:hypothetical protein
MKRLFFVSVIASLFVTVASISWAETTVKDPKSNSSERVGSSGKSKGKATKSTAAPAPQGQQDPCASVKNDATKYAACQDAAKPRGLTDIRGRGRKY